MGTRVSRERKLREIFAELEANKTDRERLLNKRDRLIIDAMAAGDSPTTIGECVGINRRMAYVIRDSGRDRKGSIDK